MPLKKADKLCTIFYLKNNSSFDDAKEAIKSKMEVCKSRLDTYNTKWKNYFDSNSKEKHLMTCIDAFIKKLENATDTRPAIEIED
jgi:hypothetical protein